MATATIPDISAVLSKIKGPTGEESATKKEDTVVPKEKAVKKEEKPVKPEHSIPKGKPKSGRIWKTQKER